MIFACHFSLSQIEQLATFPVAFFFILSGFMLAMGYSERILKGEITYFKYIRKRIIRIFPLNWVALILALFVPIDWNMNLNYYIAHIPSTLLLQSWIPLSSIYFSGNAVAWFLSDIFFFYLAFPYILRILSSKYQHMVMAAVLLIYLVLINIVPDSWNHPLIYINPMFRIVDFCIGIYLCLLWKAFPRENRPSFYFNSVIELLAGIISVFFILVYPFIAVRYSLASLYWIPSVILILAVVKSESGGGGIFSKMLSCRYLTYLGSLSFAFYMFHLIVIHWNRDISNGTCVENATIGGALLCVLVTLLLSHVYSFYLEPRIVQYLNKYE
jgi:peptidoglycan/LPS O-acetylase OafA/YrhL